MIEISDRINEVTFPIVKKWGIYLGVNVDKQFEIHLLTGTF